MAIWEEPVTVHVSPNQDQAGLLRCCSQNKKEFTKELIRCQGAFNGNDNGNNNSNNNSNNDSNNDNNTRE